MQPATTPQEDIISTDYNDGKIHVFKNPGCGPCIGVTRYLKSNLGDELNEKYVEVHDVSEDPDAHDFVKSLGYAQSPVGYFNGDHFHGFQMKKLDVYIEAIKA